ncbi:MAG TPA: RidA family protein [Chloroflexota bacterium]|nr:RidA family protein [Chloroflexota bacterium]
MPKREVIHVPGLGHGAQPIPLAVKVGSTLYTGSISGTDPATGKISSDADQQMVQAFKNLATVVKAAGGDMSGIAKVEARISDMSLRDLLNREWTATFPNPEDRPIRHTGQAEMGGGQVVQLEIIAHL